MSFKTKALNEKLGHVDRYEPAAVEETATVKEALHLMRRRQKPALMVCRKGQLVGIFTERDYLMKAAGAAKAGEPISKYMTPKPVTGGLDQTLGEAIEIMDAKHLRTLPIIDADGVPASVVTVLTVIRYLADHFPAAVVNRPPQPHLHAVDVDGA